MGSEESGRGCQEEAAVGREEGKGIAREGKQAEEE